MTDTGILTKKIEVAVREIVAAHMEEVRLAAVTAVTRAVAARPTSGARPKRGTKTTRSTRTRAVSERRGAEEIEMLASQLHALVRETPGERMASLATKLDTTVRKLYRPMSRLKRDDKVRAVGERQHTRYFPGVAGLGDAPADATPSLSASA